MATMEQLLSDSYDPCRAPGAIVESIEDYSDLSWVLERVNGCLDHALRLFSEGDPEQACRQMAEANFILERQAEANPEAGAQQVQESTTLQAEQKITVQAEQKMFLARAVSA